MSPTSRDGFKNTGWKRLRSLCNLFFQASKIKVWENRKLKMLLPSLRLLNHPAFLISFATYSHLLLLGSNVLSSITGHFRNEQMWEGSARKRPSTPATSSRRIFYTYVHGGVSGSRPATSDSRKPQSELVRGKQAGWIWMASEISKWPPQRLSSSSRIHQYLKNNSNIRPNVLMMMSFQCYYELDFYLLGFFFKLVLQEMVFFSFIKSNNCVFSHPHDLTVPISMLATAQITTNFNPPTMFLLLEDVVNGLFAGRKWVRSRLRSLPVNSACVALHPT